MLIRNLAGNDSKISTYFAIYYYLLWNGLLSNNNKFIYSEHIESEPLDKLSGFTIILGGGVCRNIASHFTELLRELEPCAKYLTIGTYVDNNDIIALPKNEFIARNISYSNVTSCEDVINKPLLNHAETFVSSNGFYIFDPTSFRINELIIDKNNSDNRFYDMRVPALFDFKHYSGTPEEILTKMEKAIELLYMTKKVPFSAEELLKIRTCGISHCVDNNELINHFRKDTSELRAYLEAEKTKVLTKKYI